MKTTILIILLLTALLVGCVEEEQGKNETEPLEIECELSEGVIRHSWININEELTFDEILVSCYGENNVTFDGSLEVTYS